MWVVTASVVMILSTWLASRMGMTWLCRRKLARFPGYRTRLAGAKLTFFPLGVRMKRIVMQSADTFASADHIEARIDVYELLAGRLVASVVVDGVTITLANAKASLPDWTPFAFAVSELLVRNAELTLVDAGRFRLHALTLRATHLATRRALLDCEESELNIEARAQSRGAFVLRATARAWLRPPVFSAMAQLRNILTAELGSQVSGTFDCIVAANAAHGQLSAAMKPVLREVGRHEEPPLAEVTTIVPLNPAVEDGRVWATLFNTMRGAFASGLDRALEALPPEPAMSRASLLAHFADEEPATAAQIVTH